MLIRITVGWVRRYCCRSYPSGHFYRSRLGRYFYHISPGGGFWAVRYGTTDGVFKGFSECP